MAQWVYVDFTIMQLTNVYTCTITAVSIHSTEMLTNRRVSSTEINLYLRQIHDSVNTYC